MAKFFLSVFFSFTLHDMKKAIKQRSNYETFSRIYILFAPLQLRIVRRVCVATAKDWRFIFFVHFSCALSSLRITSVWVSVYLHICCSWYSFSDWMSEHLTTTRRRDERRKNKIKKNKNRLKMIFAPYFSKVYFLFCRCTSIERSKMWMVNGERRCCCCRRFYVLIQTDTD